MSSRTIDRLLATVQMMSGVGFITLAFAAAGAATIVASSVELANLPVDPDAAHRLRYAHGSDLRDHHGQARSRGAIAPEVVRLWQLWRGRGALSGGNPQPLAGGRLPALGAGAQRNHLIPYSHHSTGASGRGIISVTSNRSTISAT